MLLAETCWYWYCRWTYMTRFCNHEVSKVQLGCFDWAWFEWHDLWFQLQRLQNKDRGWYRKWLSIRVRCLNYYGSAIKDLPSLRVPIFLVMFLHRCAFSFEEECKVINDKGSRRNIDTFLEGFCVCEGWVRCYAHSPLENPACMHKVNQLIKDE